MHKTFTGLLILLGLGLGSPAWAQSTAPSFEAPLPFSNAPTTIAAYSFHYSTPDDFYLQTLRDRYGLEAVAATESTTLGKVKALSLWVHNRLVHDGRIASTKTDPMEILDDALVGKSVQCIEFGRVMAAVLTAMGMPARPLFLKAADADKRGSAGGHVLTEVWLEEFQKWAVVDSQWDVLPTLNGTPVSAVELQHALANKTAGLTGETSTDAKIKFYYRWLQPYLYYFDTPLDNRYGVRTGNASLMLMPIGAKKLTMFHRTTKLSGMRYTTSTAVFYPNPLETHQAQEHLKSID
ncbi:transglutaminase-like domain-containing protein [Hymenobacter jeollabukensis]|uniref:Transglutaminase domain-containing protein n=1 Tax=Hymenobacter jeollabukensis TaxID=2025313 RepID=A0A5R8WHT7_9BACT|nr:transglutaminase-like domain-containing protein [Hymenobacter jeollabukensis]TLM88401.1 transglutaminase domain-containing protein [Hymenobacter jeollabukensis]